MLENKRVETTKDWNKRLELMIMITYSENYSKSQTSRKADASKDFCNWEKVLGVGGWRRTTEEQKTGKN